ncbi:MAG: SprB repeat-containing protein [Lewinellaceae bacterium]|nr:SprB repeat-containing protein [Lewinellaceae bacterium]
MPTVQIPLPSASINEPPPLLRALQVLSNYNGFPVACANAINGRARLNASGGTPPPYNYSSWPSGELQMEADSLPAGNRLWYVRFYQYCSLSFPWVLNAPPAIQIDLVVTGEKCLAKTAAPSASKV